MITQTRKFATATLIATVASLTLANLASASVTMGLGGGWQATIVDSDHVSLTVQSVSLESDALVIQKTADFTGIDPFTGAPQPLSIVFTQIAADALTVHHIIIADELISNHTGLAWTGFRNELLGVAATFDPLASAGFSISPFVTTTYSPSLDRVTYTGGVVPNGGTWTPGLVSGSLVMQVDLSGASPATFALKEMPQVPAPGALALLGLAGAVTSRRRKA